MLEYATLDGVVIHDLSADTNVYAEQVVGLSGFSTVRGDPIDRPENDGVVEPANQYLTARVSAWDMGVFGVTIADTRLNWTTLMQTINACVKQQKQLRWRWIGDTLAFQANVRVAGMTPPTWTQNTHGCRVMFQMLLRAADPTNYDQSPTIVATGAPVISITGTPWPIPFPVPWAFVSSGSGTVTVTNNGDADAWPVIDITGPISAPVLTNQTTGKNLYFDGLVVALGQTLSIDTNPASRAASIGGISKIGSLRLSASEFFSVSPFSTQSIAVNGTGTDVTTTMTVTLRSAYLI
jgi:hypothetical protein